MTDCRTLIAKTAFAAASMFATATPAFAGHIIVYAPRTDAYAVSMAHQGPYVQATAYRVINGTADPYYTQQGPSGSASGGGSAASSWAQVSQPGGSGTASFGNSTYSSASLDTGLLKATSMSYGPDNFGSPLGIVESRLDDTIFFTNNSGSTQTISFTYRFDGQLYSPNGSNPGGSVSLGLSCGGNIGACYNGPNNTGEAIKFADANGNPLSLYGGPRSPDDNWNYYFSANGTNCFGENIYCGQYSTSLWEYGVDASAPSGVVDGYIRAYLNIPVGETALGVRGTLNLDCRAASSCDFGNTGSFGFGTLPVGLTYGSASGVFLTANATPGGVPEPATWAMMILGFGFVGSALRRDRRRPALA